MTEFFDGITSDPQIVSPSVHAEGVHFSGKSILWAEIRGIRKVAGIWHIELIQGQLVITDDVAFMAEAFPLWSAQQKGFKRWHLQWSLQKLPKQILLGLGIGLAVGTLIYLGFAQIYRFVPLRYDTHIGEKVDGQMKDFLEPCTTAALVAFHQKALQVLGASQDRFPHDITIINDPMVNAFALPGGRIYVFRGILEESESPDEILGVIAHEVAHVEMRHGVQQLGRTIGIGFLSSMLIGADVEGLDMLQNAETMSEIGSTLLVLRYSRGFEREADLEGLRRMRHAQLPILGLGNLLVRIETKFGMDSGMVWLSTHPKSWERLKRYQEANAQAPLQVPANPAFAEERKLWSLLKNSCPEPRNWKDRVKVPWK
jgi:Zn-dependent protease with chaperone function